MQGMLMPTDRAARLGGASARQSESPLFLLLLGAIVHTAESSPSAPSQLVSVNCMREELQLSNCLSSACLVTLSDDVTTGNAQTGVENDAALSLYLNADMRTFPFLRQDATLE